jgi:tryptophan 2,3-dioxygenase
MIRTRSTYYSDYLHLDRLLSCQTPKSAAAGAPAHDEMLFIVVHQVYELWFKEILHELDRVQAIFAGEAVDDRDIAIAAHGLSRINVALRLGVQQLDLLETMTPLDFLEFREKLHGASGFQSKQFRQIEAALGLRMENRFRPEYYKHTELGGFNDKDFQEISEWEKQPSLLAMVERWLARAPFFDEPFWSEWQQAEADAAADGQSPFWARYRAIFESSLSDRDDRLEMMRKFDEIFFTTGWGDFSPEALRTALFIMLYRDQPLFRLPFALLNGLIEIDEQLATFRYRHLQMVRRMIGTRVGTGGSSGEQYLQGAVNKNYIFKELAGVITFLIERRNLPQLPERLREALRFRSAEH